MAKNLINSMDLPKLFKNDKPSEAKVTMCIYINKSTKDEIVKLAEQHIAGPKRGKLSKFLEIVFTELVRKHKKKV